MQLVEVGKPRSAIVHHVSAYVELNHQHFNVGGSK
jgi:hypothetical protein